MERNSCIGKCCEGFVFMFSPTELKSMIDTDLGECQVVAWDDGETETKHFNSEELKKIDDMLIYKGLTRINPKGNINLHEVVLVDHPNAKKFGDLEEFQQKWLRQRGYRFDEDGILCLPLYTCKHYDLKTKLCKDYENRPQMCRAFPCESKCGYDGCSYKQ